MMPRILSFLPKTLLNCDIPCQLLNSFEDGDDYYDGDEDEYEVPASWIDVYQSRFSSQAAMADWLRLEALLVLPSSDHHQSNQLHFQVTVNSINVGIYEVIK